MNEDPRKAFISRQESQIKPISNDPSLFEDLSHGKDIAEERIDTALERYETKVFTYERTDVRENAARVLVEASQSANYDIIHPLVGTLESDVRCGGLTLLTDNVSGMRFSAEQESLRLQQIRSEGSIFSDIPAGPYSSALIMYEPTDSAAPMLRESAKSVFGAERLYYFSPGLFDEKVRDTLVTQEKIDGLFVADEFSKELFCGILHLDDDRVTAIGSPLIDAIHPEHAEALRDSGRKRLDIAADAIVINYSTIVSSAFAAAGGAKELNQHTSDETVAGIIEAARENPAKSYVLLARMHPRAKGVERLPEPTPHMPPNVRIAVGDDLTYDESVYAADLICANPVSTEIMLGAYRGRTTAFLAYPGEGGVGEVANNIYGAEGLDIIEKSGRVRILRSSQQLKELLSGELGQSPMPKPAGGSAERLANVLLA